MRLAQIVRHGVTIGLCGNLLASCMVGPDFHTPAAPTNKNYDRPPHPTKTVQTKEKSAASKAQYFIKNAHISEHWWSLFHSRDINRLITLGLYHSPNLAAAKAALLQAQENLNAQIGSTMLPNINGQVQGQRLLQSGLAFGDAGSPSSLFNLFNVTVNVSYTLDIFGGLRRQIEAANAQVDFEQYELEAAYLTLTSNIVTTAVTIASLREQIKATIDIAKDLRNQLEIVEQQYRLGGTDLTNVLTQKTTLAQVEGTIPPLRLLLAQNIHALAVLVGIPPSDIDIPKFNLNRLYLPANLPVSLPSALARQRPDIRASEALLHVASANIGVATANLYPQITLQGNYGWVAPSPSTLFATQTNQWAWGGALTAPIFNGESLMAKKRAAIAAYQQAFAQYRQTVLQAFQNVADSLRAIQYDAKNFQEKFRAERAAFNAFRIAQQQYRLGGVSYLSLLVTQQQYLQTRIARIQAQAARYTDTAALFQSLGGGWWNRRSLDCSCELNRNVARYKPGGPGT